MSTEERQRYKVSSLVKQTNKLHVLENNKINIQTNTTSLCLRNFFSLVVYRNGVMSRDEHKGYKVSSLVKETHKLTRAGK